MPDPSTLTSERLPFWKRQFAPEVSGGQIVFDVAAGILLPLACLVLDPILFQPPGFLARHATLGYGAIALAWLNLAAWLRWRRPASFMAGALAAGAAISLLLGLLILPFSVAGLLAIVGALGFAPFVTSFVYWRNSLRAYELGRTGRGAGVVAAAAFVLVLALPLAMVTVVRNEVARAADQALSSDDLPTSLAALQRIRWLIDTDSFVWTYEKEKNPRRRQRLAELYWRITGRQLEARLARFDED